MDIILISTLRRAETGMKIRLDGKNPFYGDIVRKNGVGAFGNGFFVHCGQAIICRLYFKVGEKLARMYAGIRTAAAGGFNRLPEQG